MPEDDEVGEVGGLCWIVVEASADKAELESSSASNPENLVEGPEYSVLCGKYFTGLRIGTLQRPLH